MLLLIEILKFNEGMAILTSLIDVGWDREETINRRLKHAAMLLKHFACLLTLNIFLRLCGF